MSHFDLEEQRELALIAIIREEERVKALEKQYEISLNAADRDDARLKAIEMLRPLMDVQGIEHPVVLIDAGAGRYHTEVVDTGSLTNAHHSTAEDVLAESPEGAFLVLNM